MTVSPIHTQATNLCSHTEEACATTHVAYVLTTPQRHLPYTIHPRFQGGTPRESSDARGTPQRACVTDGDNSSWPRGEPNDTRLLTVVQPFRTKTGKCFYPTRGAVIIVWRSDALKINLSPALVAADPRTLVLSCITTLDGRQVFVTRTTPHHTPTLR